MRWLPAMVISSLIGFGIFGQFVSLEGLELPYYVALTGAAGLKLLSSPAYSSAKAGVPHLNQFAWPQGRQSEQVSTRTP